MNRPTGVTVVSVLMWLTGVTNVIGGIGIMDDISMGWGLTQVAIGVVAVLLGFGCWNLRSWAWMGTIVLMAVNAVSILFIWIRFNDRIIVSRAVIPLVVNVVVIAYLMQPEIKRAFDR